MNPNTYLCPVLGVYKIKINKHSSSPPISFLLMRNVLNIDPEEINPEDKVYCFDLKGSVHGRRTLENPIEILNYEENYDFHKNLILKDIDFFQSFRKLDITTIQAERIISQISEDTNFLSQHNFMDYSLLLYIVIKPYQQVVSNIQIGPSANDSQINIFKSIDMQSKDMPYKPPQMPNFNMEPGRYSMNVMPSKDAKRLERAKKNVQTHAEEDSKALHQTVRRLSEMIDLEDMRMTPKADESGIEPHRKTLFISESTAKPKVHKTSRHTHYRKEKPVLVLKEKKNKKLRVYHICNVNDISNLKAIEQDEKRRVSMIQCQKSKFNSIAEGFSDDEQQNDPNYSKESENFDEFFDRSGGQISIKAGLNNSRPSAVFFGRESVTTGIAGPSYGRSSILNFKGGVTKQKYKGDKPSEYKINVQGEHYDDYAAALEKKMKEIDMRLERDCHNCKAGCKENHIIELSDCMEDSDEDKAESIDEPWKDISDTDVIEQVIFDPQLGMIKREIHFGIIDYITTFTLMKKIEEKIKGVIQDDPSAVRPQVYAGRFMDCAKSAFE
jgi:hypothetical protein